MNFVDSPIRGIRNYHVDLFRHLLLRRHQTIITDFPTTITDLPTTITDSPTTITDSPTTITALPTNQPTNQHNNNTHSRRDHARHPDALGMRVQNPLVRCGKLFECACVLYEFFM